MFTNGSRYKNMPNYETIDSTGKKVKAVVLPLPTESKPAGEHRLLEGQRLDHLASQYLGDPTAFWRICDMNNAMHPDELKVIGKKILIPIKE
jgi:hypothetical protein